MVAVLEIHMDRPALTPNSMNTATDILPFAINSTLSAIALSNSCLFSAAANAKPPMNKKMIGFEKLASAAGVLNTPNKTANRGTSKAVMLT